MEVKMEQLTNSRMPLEWNISWYKHIWDLIIVILKLIVNWTYKLAAFTYKRNGLSRYNKNGLKYIYGQLRHHFFA